MPYTFTSGREMWPTNEQINQNKMNKTEASRYIEDVKGEIIGDFYSTGQLFKDGRAQGPRFNGTDEEIRQQAQKYIIELKEKLGAEYKRLYPDGFELRIQD